MFPIIDAAAGMAFRFVDAVDGRTAPVPDTFDGARVIRRPFGYESEVACSASHRKLAPRSPACW